MKLISTTARVCLSLLMCSSAAAAATTTVSAGGNLQAALNNAQPGDTIALEPGATYIGTFTLPNKSGSSVITLRTGGDAGLPRDRGRISPGDAGGPAEICSGSRAPSL